VPVALAASTSAAPSDLSSALTACGRSPADLTWIKRDSSIRMHEIVRRIGMVQVVSTDGSTGWVIGR
jgi:hypothetical protein